MRAHQQQLATALAFVALVLVQNRAFAQDADVAVEWNRILDTTVAGTATPSVFFTRPYALTSLAVFDALNSIDRAYSAYASQMDAPNASREAAAQAAHDVLVALYPTQQAVLTATLNQYPGGDAAREGSRVGAAAARAMPEQRADDGWNRQPTAYLLTSLPGYYQITPPQNATVTLTHYPDVQP